MRISSSARRPRGLAAAAAGLLLGGLPAATQAATAPSQTQLVTGKKISPQSTGTQNVGSLPMNMVLTPDGKYALVSDMGFRQYLTCLDAKTGQLAQPITSTPPTPTDGSVALPPVSKSLLAFGAPYSGRKGLYYGLAVKGNADGTYTVYAAQGANASVAVVTVAADGSLSQTGTIKMQPSDFPAGLSLDRNGLLYVAVNVSNTAPLTTPSSLVVYNTATAAGTSGPAPEVSRVLFNTGQDYLGTYQTLSHSTLQPGRTLPFTPPSYAYAVSALPDGSKVYVSSQRDGGIYSIGLTNGVASAPKFIKTGTQPVVAAGTPGAIVGGSHPVAFAYDGVAKKLYVANAQDDSVSVISTAGDTVTGTISLRPQGAAGIPGVTPTGLFLTADGRTLYATLGDMNAVAVVDTAAGTVTGAIPAGWYPSAVAVGGSGNLLVANAKGTAAANPNPGHVKTTPASPNEYEDTFYDLSIIEGNVLSLPIPDAPTLAGDTAQVIANNVGGSTANDTLTQIGLAGSKQIRHVIYIVKENRTYDQVLGDVQTVNGQAVNGDAGLAVFGQKVTPNLHALETQFVWLDNFYDASEVSPDGWNWATSAMANEYTIKNVPYQYSSRGRQYDFEGQNNGYIVGGFPAKSPEGTAYSAQFPNGAAPITDVATEPGGFIWDAVERAGLTFRNYGFFTSTGSARQIPDNYPGELGLTPGGHYTGGLLDRAANGYTDVDFRKFDTDYADSDAPTTGGNSAPYPRRTYGKFNAPSRFQEWNREFQAMLASARADGGNYDKYVPSLMTVKLMSDHTAGYSTGKPTPAAHLADNDYGVAELARAVSQSPIWNNTAIFVIEDDAQDGPDHVDCHRSTCYVISPYVKPNTVDHTFHNSASVIKSIGLLLGVGPLNQNDAYAPSFGPDFQSAPSGATVALLPEDTGTVTQTASAAFLKANPQYARLAKLSDKMDFSKEDLVPAQALNEIIWKSVKGVGSPMPAPRHGVLPVAAPSAAAKAAPARDADGD